MRVVRKCSSLPAMQIHNFSTKPVWIVRKPMDPVPMLEKAGFIELNPLEFSEWITRKSIAHFLPNTNPNMIVHSDDVTSWIGRQRYETAQNNIALGYVEYFNSPGGVVVLLVALYYLTSHRDRFTYATLREDILEEMNNLDEGPRLSEAVRFAVVLYGSAVWLAATWLQDDVACERRYWGNLMYDADVQAAEENTRSMLEVLEYRLSIDQGDLLGWVDQAVKQFPLEFF